MAGANDNRFSEVEQLISLGIHYRSLRGGCEPASFGFLPVMAKGDGREVGFQDGGYFSKFLKRERINNQTFIAFLNCG